MREVMPFKFRAVLALICTFLFGCISDGYDCDRFPRQFDSYDAELSALLNSKWRITEHCNSSCASSSFINEMSYYSCDGESGYLVISMNGKKYTFKDVPVNLWKEFLTSDSKGKFYSQHIRGRNTNYMNLK